MRGKVAKKMRKMAYGDYALNSEMVKSQTKVGGMVQNTGLRKNYQQLKKDYKGIHNG